MALTIHDNLKNPPEEAAAIFNRELAAVLEAQRDKSVLTLFSGGSALSILDHLDVSLFRSNVTMSVLDERYSSQNSQSNFAKLFQKSFFKHATENGAQCIDTRVGEGETMAALASRFDTALKTWREQHPDGVILVTQGIGEDGHTAGIVGGAMKSGEFMGTFEDSDMWAVGYDLLPTQSEHLHRVTTTLAFLTHQVDFSLVYVSGESKHSALRNVLSQQGYLSDIPALIIHSMRRVELCADFPVR